MSTQPQFLYIQCQFCGKELPRCQFDEHTVVCPLYQSQFLNARGSPRVAKETDQYASSSIVTGKSQTGHGMGRYLSTARSREVHIIALTNEDYGSSVELQLPSGLQETNRNASSCLVIGISFQSKYTNILFRLQRLLERMNSILDKIENIMDKIESVIKVRSHTW